MPGLLELDAQAARRISSSAQEFRPRQNAGEKWPKSKGNAMSTKTKIEWADATWNPIRGCSRVSEGCRNCYAERQAYRFAGPGKPYEGLVRWIGPKHSGHPQWTGKLALADEKTLMYPLRLKKPHRIFVNSMSDLFHEKVPGEWIERIFTVMGDAPQHIFQILTKRPKRMHEWFAREWKMCGEIAKPFENVWLGVSVEDQKTAEERIPLLLQTPAAIRWISYEPALGPVDLGFLQPNREIEIDSLKGTHGVYRPHGGKNPSLDWVVAGGESGPGARPAHPDWFRRVRDECIAAGVPFFFKQWGEWVEGSEEMRRFSHEGRLVNRTDKHGYYVDHSAALVMRVGKKKAGRLLDGRTWDEFPNEINEGKKSKVLLDGVMMRCEQ